MKWALLAVAVFVCAFALFTAVPRPVMLGAFDAAGHSFRAFVNVVCGATIKMRLARQSG